MEPSSFGENYTSLKAQPQSYSIQLTLPSITPSAGQYLSASQSNPTQLEWKTPVLVASNMSTAERDAITSPTIGLIIFNTDTSRHQGYNGRGWHDLY
jgi:hypothetical protein